MQQIISIGLILIVLGVLAVFAGLFFQGIEGQKGGTDIHGGAVVFIGPIPVIIGTDRDSAVLVSVLAVILIAIAYFFLRR